MLSRVAESLYWTARYIERAEAVSRLAVVNFQARLDGARTGGWDDVVGITSDVELYRGLCEQDDERSALRFLFTHPSNPNGVISTLSRARENARGIRDQVSSEVWEHVNKLYLLARDGAAAMADEPYAFFRQVRDGSQAFEGITAATMTHGEAYQFIQLGRYLERAVTTVRTLAVRYQEVRSFEDGTAASNLGLMTLLKSCGAFEPYRRAHAAQLQARLVAEYLLLSPLFPRAVLFCLERASRCVGAISPTSTHSADRLEAPARLLGRLRADLSYLDTGDALEEGLPLLLDHLVRKIHQVGNEITRSYFNARVILPSTSGGPPIQQQQQQQQQGGTRVKLRIVHTTTFTYDSAVSEAYMEMRLTPLDAGGQRCESFRLATDPPGEARGYPDRFGNHVRHFDTLAPHDRLVVTARSEVQTPVGYTDPDTELSLLDAYDYRQATAYTPQTASIRAFAQAAVVPGDPLASAHAVSREVHRALAYTPGSTTVRTTADEALGAARGVCQDFAHVMIAACRALELPARYVSGYMFAPQRGTASASHAWVDVFVPGPGWISLDPTHDVQQTDHYVRLAVGRDYSDVPPTRGVYKGTGRESMAVDVRVEQA